MNKKSLETYHHCCCRSPMLTTCLTEINNGNFCTWLGLTTELIIKHLKETSTSAKGLLRNTNKTFRSIYITLPMNNNLNDNNQTDKDTRNTSEKKNRYMIKLKKQAKHIQIKQDGSKSCRVRGIGTSWYYKFMNQRQKIHNRWRQ